MYDPYDLEAYWKAVRPTLKGGRGRISNLLGQHFGRLVVLERFGTDKYGGSTWLCQCSCPQHTLKIVARRDLKQGRVKSCGCLLKEYRKQPKPAFRRFPEIEENNDDDDDGGGIIDELS